MLYDTSLEIFPVITSGPLSWIDPGIHSRMFLGTPPGISPGIYPGLLREIFAVILSGMLPCTSPGFFSETGFFQIKFPMIYTVNKYRAWITPCRGEEGASIVQRVMYQDLV